MRLIDLLNRSASKYPDRIAVKDDICEMTYKQLVSNVEVIRDYLESAGCSPGVRIAIILPASAAYLSSFFAISATGATIVPMSSKMTVYEIADIIKRANVSFILIDKSVSNKLLKPLLIKEHISILTIEQGSDPNSKIEILESDPPKVDCDNRDVALMVCTAGTTSRSKIVMLTDDQLISNMFSYREIMGFSMPNVVYCSLPLNHIYFISAQLLTHISLCDTLIVTHTPFFIKDFFNAVQTYKVSITSFVPYMAMLMAEYPEPDCFNLSSLRYITLAGAKTPKAVYEKLTNIFDHIKFINTYGLSEASPRISITAPDPCEFPVESVGKPLPGVKIRIIDENGNILPVGYSGEIEVKGSGICKGYFNEPQLTSQTIINGWLRTGDIGRLDTEGNLYIVGRKKEIILCGGENIYPGEIEEVLLENSFIKDAAVIGIPDDRLEEVPCTFVVPKNCICREADIINYCRNKLSNYKVPRKVFFLDNIPRLGTSKVDRKLLKKIALEKLRMDL